MGLPLIPNEFIAHSISNGNYLNVGSFSLRRPVQVRMTQDEKRTFKLFQMTLTEAWQGVPLSVM